jgi:hypothetical protein
MIRSTYRTGDVESRGRSLPTRRENMLEATSLEKDQYGDGGVKDPVPCEVSSIAEIVP